MLSQDICLSDVSVNLSVCPSVTCRYSIKMVKCCYDYRSYDFYRDISELSYRIFIAIFPVRVCVPDLAFTDTMHSALHYA